MAPDAGTSGLDAAGSGVQLAGERRQPRFPGLRRERKALERRHLLELLGQPLTYLPVGLRRRQLERRYRHHPVAVPVRIEDSRGLSRHGSNAEHVQVVEVERRVEAQVLVGDVAPAQDRRLVVPDDGLVVQCQAPAQSVLVAVEQEESGGLVAVHAANRGLDCGERGVGRGGDRVLRRRAYIRFDRFTRARAEQEREAENEKRPNPRHRRGILVGLASLRASGRCILGGLEVLLDEAQNGFCERFARVGVLRHERRGDRFVRSSRSAQPPPSGRR